jgi:hypothetical protein
MLPISNFAFLSGQDAQLAQLGALAERYFRDDPGHSSLQTATIWRSLGAHKIGGSVNFYACTAQKTGDGGPTEKISASICA